MARQLMPPCGNYVELSDDRSHCDDVANVTVSYMNFDASFVPQREL